ncbi:MAG: ATP-binding protein [Lawsonella clevelandensis]
MTGCPTPRKSRQCQCESEGCLAASGNSESPGDFSDIRGQRPAVEAALIAAAGGHHLLMLGPPGAGKSMIAQRSATILPPLTYVHALEVTALHSLRGRINPAHPLITQPPFEAPHAGITPAALLGGGSGYALPGVVSLHIEVFSSSTSVEIPAGTLDMLRTPLQEGEVRLGRSKGTVTYPSRCQLVLAGNSCPCGAPSPQDCRCSSATRARYRARASPARSWIG